MSSVQKWLDALTKYGLTETQAKVYCNLLKAGKTSSAQIGKMQRVHRAEIYRVLRELEEKGIVKMCEGRPMLFTPMSPAEAINALLAEREMNLQHLKENSPELINWLKRISKDNKAGPYVLLIDDDEKATKSLSILLQGEGFDVDTAKDGGEALKKAGSRLYNVALVDIRLPDIEGTKLIKMLREMNPDIKEIVMTGYPSVQNAIDAVNEGADAYFLKPFNPKDLVTKMKEKLRESA